MLVAVTYLGFVRIPTGFLPNEDNGLMLVNVQLPDGASLERTKPVMDRVCEILKGIKGTSSFTLVPGWSIIDGNAPNVGGGFVELLPWDERLSEGRTLQAIMGEFYVKASQIQEAIVFPFTMPPIHGVGTAGGFEMQIQDRTSQGLVKLEEAANEIAHTAGQRPEMRQVMATFRSQVPNLYVDVDRVKAFNLNVSLDSVFDTMQTYLGSTYVNDFNKYGRTWQLLVQADSPFRMRARDIGKLQVRNSAGKMIPLGTLVQVKESLGPMRVDRYNMYASAKVLGEGKPGISSGKSLQIMEKIAAEKLPYGMGYEWTGMAYQEKMVSGQMPFVLGLAIFVVVLILAAQYESWIDPIAVVLVVPLAVLGAVIALTARHLDNNLYTQVGLVLLVGLAAKNAILIVEFARQRLAQGKAPDVSAVEGSTIRLRPVLMTSFAFVFGVFPLAIATGAGAASRQALGTAVVGGMLGVTVLGIFFTPVLWVLMQKLKRSVLRLFQTAPEDTKPLPAE